MVEARAAVTQLDGLLESGERFLRVPVAIMGHAKGVPVIAIVRRERQSLPGKFHRTGGVAVTETRSVGEEAGTEIASIRVLGIELDCLAKGSVGLGAD